MPALSRRRVGEPVVLNVYDLSPANEHLRFVGLGAFHSGVEVHGTEYTFSNSGVFSTAPKDANGAPLCESVVLGEVFMGSSEVARVVDELRHEWRAGTYNLLKKNCNSFADALVNRLLNRSIPGWVNRSATLGQYCSCFMPDEAASAAPVDSAAGGGGPSSGGGFHVIRGRGGPSKPKGREVMSFAGGGSSSFTTPDAGEDGARARTKPAAAAPGRRLGSLAGAGSSAAAAPAPASSWWGGAAGGAAEPRPAAPAVTAPASERRSLMLKATLKRQAAARDA